MKGDKSQVLEIDQPDLERFPLFPLARRYECELEPGDAIFIPCRVKESLVVKSLLMLLFEALWLHNVITLSFSIGVNIFWKHLDDSFYEKKDIYGNKDLTFASKAILFVDKSIKEINQLPVYYREFYTKRLIQMLNDNLNQIN